MRNRTISWIILAFALLFVGTSVWFTHHLSQQFAEVEQQRMEVWAEATRLLVLADENTDISLYSSIIEANTTIPVYMTDADYHVILTRNVQEPKQDVEAHIRLLHMLRQKPAGMGDHSNMAGISLILCTALHHERHVIEIGMAVQRGIPTIVYDPYGMADNCMLTESPTLVSCDLDEVISKVFTEYSKQYSNGTI